MHGFMCTTYRLPERGVCESKTEDERCPASILFDTLMIRQAHEVMMESQFTHSFSHDRQVRRNHADTYRGCQVSYLGRRGRAGSSSQEVQQIWCRS